jgi:hypothetical protein
LVAALRAGAAYAFSSAAGTELHFEPDAARGIGREATGERITNSGAAAAPSLTK